MNCIKAESIQKYIDKETNEAGKYLIEEHLKLCSACREKVEAKRRFAKFIVQSVNQLEHDEDYIPAFIPVKHFPSSKITLKRKILYSVSAACMLLMVIFSIVRISSDNPKHINIVNIADPQIDANKPITDQEMIINVIDPEGNVTELKLE